MEKPTQKATQARVLHFVKKKCLGRALSKTGGQFADGTSPTGLNRRGRRLTGSTHLDCLAASLHLPSALLDRQDQVGDASSPALASQITRGLPALFNAASTSHGPTGQGDALESPPQPLWAHETVRICTGHSWQFMRFGSIYTGFAEDSTMLRHGP